MRTRRFLEAGLAANLVALIYAAVCLKPLQNDGAYWLFRILLERGPFYDSRLCRWLDVVLQLPVLLVDHLSSGDSLRAQVLAFCLSYSLHPFLSLAACAWICVKARAPWAFLFPLLSFATATQMTLGYGTGVIPDSLDLFWPVLLTQLFFPARSWISRGSAVLGATALVFTHEWAMLLVLALFGSTLARLDEEPRLWPRSEITWRLAVFGFAFLTLCYLAIRHTGASSGFTVAVHEPWGLFTSICLAATLSFPVLCLAREYWPRHGQWAPAWAGGLTVFYLGYYAFRLATTPSSVDSPFFSLFSRVPAVPVAALLGLSFHLAVSRLPRAHWRDQAFWRIPGAFVGTLLLLAAAQTVVQTLSWNRGIRNFRTELALHREGCRLMPAAEYEERINNYDIRGWAAGTMTFYLQDTRHPTQVLSDEGYVTQELKQDFCAGVLRGSFLTHWWDHRLKPGAPLSFDRIRERREFDSTRQD